MSKTIDFIFDFGSPNAYLSHKVMPDIVARTGATVNYIPCLLGGIFKATGNVAPMIAFGNVKGKLEYDRIEMMRFVKKHGLSAFRINPHFPVNTLILMRGAVAAEMRGDLATYIEAGLKAMWEDGLKMDDPVVYVEAMNAAGLDGATLLEATQDPDVKAKLVANTEAAIARGTFGIPTFFVGDEMFFGKDRLGQVEEEVQG
ncbi:2-hydroxychromene-2-carboxylate isomerase [Hyphomonas oceanitis]|uniref:2-hydroxychromene-2-carboxylate isomerase n=1 Tax=Hyphomonas oceanitis SCH89 TaxID=1280953 RepID=A0A059G9J1_9PROT|nr:2-hydroxychromene-2-carboxylate isomerase [Hyphomonas oceanitis]KDA03153.1 2-hydroxychromene-2-carboxylate isomerase [Hyphomonas oceanitis SCH89]